MCPQGVKASSALGTEGYFAEELSLLQPASLHPDTQQPLWLFLHRVFGPTLQAPSLCHLFHPPW